MVHYSGLKALNMITSGSGRSVITVLWNNECLMGVSKSYKFCTAAG
jgi:hypothetical protein